MEYDVFKPIFDERSICWDPSEKTNEMFLKNEESWAYERLKKYRYLFLSDVYGDLGLEPIPKMAYIYGWWIDRFGNNDNHPIDFGMEHIEGSSNFKLNFKCDGVVLANTDRFLED